MALERTVKTNGVTLSDTEQRHIDHQLDMLEKRLVHHPDPTAAVTLTRHHNQRVVEVDLRVQLGPLGQHLVSHQSAETTEHAVRDAVHDVERQLERRLATQRGEPTFGVPSRRLPATLRPSTLPVDKAAEAPSD